MAGGMHGRGSMCGGGGMHGRGGMWQGIRPLQQMVCILLECILVLTAIIEVLAKNSLTNLLLTVWILSSVFSLTLAQSPMASWQAGK